VGTALVSLCASALVLPEPLVSRSPHPRIAEIQPWQPITIGAGRPPPCAGAPPVGGLSGWPMLTHTYASGTVKSPQCGAPWVGDRPCQTPHRTPPGHPDRPWDAYRGLLEVRYPHISRRLSYVGATTERPPAGELITMFGSPRPIPHLHGPYLKFLLASADDYATVACGRALGSSL